MAATFVTRGRGDFRGLLTLVALVRAGLARALAVGVASGNHGIQSSRFGEVVGRGRALGLVVVDVAGFPLRTVIRR